MDPLSRVRDRLAVLEGRVGDDDSERKIIHQFLKDDLEAIFGDVESFELRAKARKETIGGILKDLYKDHVPLLVPSIEKLDKDDDVVMQFARILLFNPLHAFMLDENIDVVMDKKDVIQPCYGDPLNFGYIGRYLYWALERGEADTFRDSCLTLIRQATYTTRSRKYFATLDTFGKGLPTIEKYHVDRLCQVYNKSFYVAREVVEFVNVVLDEDDERGRERIWRLIGLSWSHIQFFVVILRHFRRRENWVTAMSLLPRVDSNLADIAATFGYDNLRTVDRAFRLPDIFYSLVGSTLAYNKHYGGKSSGCPKLVVRDVIIRELHKYQYLVCSTREAWTCFAKALALIQLCHDRKERIMGRWLSEVIHGGEKTANDDLCQEIYDHTKQLERQLLQYLCGESERTVPYVSLLLDILFSRLTPSEMCCFYLTIIFPTCRPWKPYIDNNYYSSDCFSIKLNIITYPFIPFLSMRNKEDVALKERVIGWPILYKYGEDKVCAELSEEEEQNIEQWIQAFMMQMVIVTLTDQHLCVVPYRIQRQIRIGLYLNADTHRLTLIFHDVCTSELARMSRLTRFDSLYGQDSAISTFSIIALMYFRIARHFVGGETIRRLQVGDLFYYISRDTLPPLLFVPPPKLFSSCTIKKKYAERRTETESGNLAETAVLDYLEMLRKELPMRWNRSLCSGDSGHNFWIYNVNYVDVIKRAVAFVELHGIATATPENNDKQAHILGPNFVHSCIIM